MLFFSQLESFYVVNPFKVIVAEMKSFEFVELES
jgi:hypothetical protein